MKKGLITLFVVLSIAILATACAQSPSKNEPVKIKAVVLPYTSFGPFFIAQEEGFFTDYNLEVEFVRMDSGSSPLALLEEGSIDVLGSGPNLGLFNALASGSDIRIVADKGYLAKDGCTYMALLASKDWVEKNQTLTADSLRNAKVSIDPINFEAFMFDQVLQSVGLTQEDINIQDISPAALSDALSNKAVDIVSIGDPWIVKLTGSGETVVWKPYQEIVPNMQFGVILFNDNLIKNNPDAGVRFLAALLKGVEQYNQGKTDRNIEIMAKYTNLDPEILKKACWPPMNTSGEINFQAVDAFQAWAFQKGLIEKQIPVSGYWYPDLLKKAEKLLKK